MNDLNSKFEINIFYDNYIVRDHRVFGIRIVPAVALIEIAYRILNEEFPENKIVLKNVIFKEPIAVTTDFDKKIVLNIKKMEMSWNISIISYKMRENNILPDSYVENFEAELYLEEYDNNYSNLDIASLKNKKISSFDFEKVYASARRMKIDHYDFMKAKGKVYQLETSYLAKITLGELAKKYHDRFYIHPTYLDASIAISIYNNELNTCYIPMYIRELRMIKSATSVCYINTLIKPLDKTQDLIIHDIKGYDKEGNEIFFMKDLMAKKIRFEDSIKKLKQIDTLSLKTYHEINKNDYKTADNLINEIKKIISELTHKPITKINYNANYYELGLDSLDLIKIVQALEQILNCKLYPTLLFEYNTIKKLADYLSSQHVIDNFPAQFKSEKKEDVQSYKNEINENDIAIIGVSGIYPDAENLIQFWTNLKSGKNSIIGIPKERWDYSIYFVPSKDKESKCYSKWGGFIKDVDKFDPLFFNISPNEAELMDPQERLFLEVTHNVLDDAGYSSEDLSKQTVGVFVGVMYGQYQLFSVEEIAKGNDVTTDSFYCSVANYVSYFFDFHGPSIALDTACSSSLTTIHLACKSILNGECQLAIAGGVNTSIHPYKYLLLCQKKFLSSDGLCKSFGEDGDGYVPGEGIGAVLLKPLKQAIRDRDNIYGVIKASVINHGGRTAGYTVPNPSSQASLIKNAIEQSKIESSTINYIETHGTGTSLGDPIEIAGLSRAFGKNHKKNSCLIGSVKSNIGHLESAAGIAAVTKVLLQLKHKQIVPSLHSSNLNPHINFDESPFKVVQDLVEWKRIDNYPLRAGISSFGAGGANAHVIIEEAPPLPVVEYIHKPAYLFALSAKSEYSLKQKIKELIAYLETNDALLENISFTLNAGRSHFDLRCALVASSKEELKETLKKLNDQQNVKNAFINFTPVEEQEDDVIYKKVFKQIMQELSDGQALSDDEYRDNLLALAKFYTKGYDLDWERLHQGESKRRVSLPGYPFLKKRCWVKVVPPLTLPYPCPHLQENALEEDGSKTKALEGQYINRSENVVSELYDEVFLESKDKETKKQYLTFGPFREIVPSFSWSSAFMLGEQKELLIKAQIEMRNVLFRRVDFDECQNMLDFGCGYGNDLIQLTQDYPHLQLCGYTISKEQAWVGNNNIKNNNLTDRVVIYHRDSSTEEFPDNFDVIFGFEVAHHIKNKEALFENISHHLTKIGKLILADFISHEDYTIEHEKTGSYFITRRAWSELLTKHHLQLVECIDVSQEIANFLHDEQFDKNFVMIVNPAVKEAFLSYHQLEKLLREKMASYVLLAAIPSSSDMSDIELKHYNEDILRYAILYKEVSDEKQWFYQKVWKKKEVSKPGDLNAKKVVIVANRENEKLAEVLKNKLSAEVVTIENDSMYRNEWIKLLSSMKKSFDSKNIIFLNNYSTTSAVMPEASVSESSGIQSLSRQKALDARSPGKKHAGTSARQPTLTSGMTEQEISGAYVLSDIEAFQRTLLQTLALLQAITSTYSKNTPKLWFITRGVEKGTLDQSAIAVMARTFALEMPNFKCASIDVASTLDDEKICDEITKIMTSNESEILVDEEGIKVAELEKIKVEDNTKVNYDRNATVLITGAFGGLGMQILQYYISKGMKHFILIARHEPSELIANTLNKFKEKGIEIITAQADVVDKTSLEAILQNKNIPPIKYIVHIAGIIKDSAILNQTKESFETVIRTKALGAWNLHEITKELPIKEFILFSSVAGILGSPGQINYAAGNAFLEVLVKYRRSLNLPAKAIAWGAWAEVGMAAHMAPKAHLGLIKLGGYDIAPKQGIKAYEIAEALDISNVIVAPIDWQRYQMAVSGGMTEGRSALVSDVSGITAKFKTILRNYVNEITGIELQEINDKKTFAEMGIDSVMAMKLRNRIQAHLGDQIKIPANAVYEHPTIADFVVYLGKQIGTIEQSEGPNGLIQIKRFKLSEMHEETETPIEKQIINIIHQGYGVWREGEEIVVVSAKPITVVPSKSFIQLEENKKYYPLSNSQEVMCIQSELYKNLSYQLSAAFYINEAVDLKILEQALNQVVQRHEILRTIFPKVDHQLVQVVLPSIDVKLQSVDFTGLKKDQVQNNVEELMKQAKTKIFNLAAAPLFTVICCKINTNKYLIILNVHHAIFDGFSVPLLIQDWMAFYRQSMTKEDLQAQYADYVLEKINISNETKENEINWWREKLKGAPLQSNIPSDFQNVKEISKQSGLEVLTIDNNLHQILIEFCKSHDLSKTQVVLGALYLLINKVTQQDDIIIGTVLNERTREVYENNIGDFNNYVPLRLSINQEQDKIKLLNDVKNVFADALAHQHVSFQEILRHIPFKRNRNQLPFYNVFLDSFNYDVIQKDVPNVKLYPFSHEITSLNLSPLMDLFFVLVQQDGQLSLTCFYNQNLLKPETVKNYLNEMDKIIKHLIGISDYSTNAVMPGAGLRFAPARQASAANGSGIQGLSQQKTLDARSFASLTSGMTAAPSSPLSSNSLTARSLPPQASTNRILRERTFVCIPGTDGKTDVFKRFLATENNLLIDINSYNHKSVETLASDVLNELKRYQSKKYTLVGLSTGGIIAFEVLQQLKGQSEIIVDELILLDSPSNDPGSAAGWLGNMSLDDLARERHWMPDRVHSEKHAVNPSGMTEGNSLSMLLLLIMNYMLKYFATGKLYDVISFNKDTKDMSYEQQEVFVYTWIKTNTKIKLESFKQFSQWMSQIKCNLEAILTYQASPYEDKNIEVTFVSSSNVDEHPLRSLLPDLFKEKINKIEAWSQLFPKINLKIKTIENTDHFTLFQGENITKLRDILSDVSPLSYGQERMYFAYLLNRNIPSYNCYVSIHLSGELQIEALKNACTALLNRHQILKSIYQNQNGQVYCKIRDQVIDFDTLKINDDNLIQNEINKRSQKLFDLEQGPVVRFTLIIKNDNESILHIAVQHIVIDGASFESLIKDLGELYNANLLHKGPTLQPLALQYIDFSKQQRQWINSDEAKKQLAYWKAELKDANTFLQLPADKERLDVPQHHMKVYSIPLSKNLSNQLNQFTKAHKLNLASCFLAAYQLLLAKLSGQQDFVIGVLTSARTRLEIENLIGFFINILPIKSKLTNETSFINTIKNCEQSLKKASENQEFPIENLLSELKLERKLGENPLFQCAFVYQSYLSGKLPKWQGVELTHFEVDNGISNDDLVLEVRPSSSGMTTTFELLFKYNTDLFYSQTVHQFANLYHNILEEGMAAPSKNINLHQETKTVCIAANFTAESVQEPLKFWMNQFDLNVKLEFSPYNQLMQVLLDPNSSYRKNKSGINIALIRLEDWLSQHFAYPRLVKIINEFIDAIKTYADVPHASLVICVCPPSPHFLEKFVDKEKYENLEEDLLSSLEKLNGIYLITQHDMYHYWVKNYYDAITDVSAHVPYTRLYFAALGTILARKLFSILAKPYKVIVLDGDNTLWKGVLGEDGVKGVKIQGSYEYLQKFMVKQYEAGMLLALCTKNNEKDIEELFKQRKDLPLNLEHFAALKICWQPKSKGLKELAKELNLSLANFIFIDDNPVEIAEVRANCPQVLTLCLPDDPEKIPEFLNHIWVFDHLRITETDKERTELYQQNIYREKFKKSSKTFKEFMDSLNLEILLAPMQKQDRERVAQLTQRTTQFNMTNIIKKESELDNNVLIVHVKDRFGSYGLTGAIFYELKNKKLVITNFLLSCRVLGKGVEHHIVSELGKLAEVQGCKEIVFHFKQSERNKPAKLFLQQLPAKEENEGYIVKVNDAIAFKFDAEKIKESPETEVILSENDQYNEVQNSLIDVMQKTATEWNTPEKIVQCIHQVLLIHPTAGISYNPPRTSLEEKIANIFCQLLHVEQLSVTENFFDLGVNSLMTVHAQSLLASELHNEIPLLAFFNHPSVRKLAAYISQTSNHHHIINGEERAILELAARRKRNGG